MRPGKIVLTYFDSHMDNILWFWSVAVAGGVPTIISPLANDLKIREAQVANIESIFGKAPVVTSQRLASNLEPTTSLQIVSTSDISRANHLTNGTPQVESDNASNGDLAVILLTSGSTGGSKAVEFSHAQLIASVVDKKAFHGIHSGTTFGSWICKPLSPDF